MIKNFEEFTKEVKESFSKLDFEPINWGVEDFDNESEDDLGISVTISRSIAGGREGIESHWKIYAIEDFGESWNVKAICIDSEDSRYQPEDEVQFEIYKEDDVWDLETILKDTLEEEGF